MLGMAKTLNKAVKGKLNECRLIEISLQNKKNNSRKQGGGYRVTGHFVIKRRIITKIMGRTYNRQTTMTLMIKTHIPHWKSTYQLFQKQACRFLGSRVVAGIRSYLNLTGE